MLKRTLTFKDLDGNDITEDFYFALNKAELAEMELSHKGGLTGHLKRLIETEDGDLIISTFKDVILKAVGRRSEDARRFIKNQEIRDDFEQSNAYSELFMELVQDANAAAEFINGVVPSELTEKVAAGERVTDIPIPDETPEWISENREPTKQELMEASPAQLQEAFRRKQSQ